MCLYVEKICDKQHKILTKLKIITPICSVKKKHSRLAEANGASFGYITCVFMIRETRKQVKEKQYIPESIVLAMQIKRK